MNTKQDHARRLKPLKPVLNPTLYQFVVWAINQRWRYQTISNVRSKGTYWYYKLWKK